ncbi:MULTISPECIES: DUF2913 family protein [Vibrio]|uniref:DUF2913 family protein n=1 Tax=Vibrio TaxID=662 RepID=UPI00031CB573|nr:MULTISPECIES: DUF2913 family protein [Vibrio]OCH57269.1 hypothetical protein A6E08_18600 [Vibrio lentus]
MGKNFKHYQALDGLVTSALLALYCTMSQKGGFWTTQRRNEQLVKFIKPTLKKVQFATCKNEIRAMIGIGRRATGNLEQKLWEVNAMNLAYRARFTPADELYIMLNALYEQHQFSSMLENAEEAMEIDTLYMKAKGVENGFDADNNQIKPLTVAVKTQRLDTLIQAVQANGVYRVDIDSVDEQQVNHLLLHRISSPPANEGITRSQAPSLDTVNGHDETFA